MRVTSSSLPDMVSVSRCVNNHNFDEIRVREGIVKVGERYKYDEYIIRVPHKEGILNIVIENISSWIETGKEIEVPHGASVVAQYNDAISKIEAAAAPTTFYAVPGASISDRANAVIANIQDMKAALSLLDVQPEVT